MPIAPNRRAIAGFLPLERHCTTAENGFCAGCGYSFDLQPFVFCLMFSHEAVYAKYTPAIGYSQGECRAVGFENGEFWGDIAIVLHRSSGNRKGNPVETTSMAETDTNTERRQAIYVAIADYLVLVEKGTSADREAFLIQHAAIADELRDFLGNYSMVKRHRRNRRCRTAAGRSESSRRRRMS